LDIWTQYNESEKGIKTTTVCEVFRVCTYCLLSVVKSITVQLLEHMTCIWETEHEHKILIGIFQESTSA
jgi:hypothetical protein